jgi:diamine N-acetyltransferase
MEIRSATEKDYGKVFDLIKEFSVFIKTPEKVTITLEQMIKDKNSFGCLVACEKNEIIGYAIYFFAYYSWTGKSLYMDDLYVKENFRGQKVGSSLLNKIIEVAKRENCTKVRWQVSCWNKKAIEFYRKHGADIDDIEKNCDLKLNSIKS